MRLPLAEFFSKRTQLREDRNHKAGVGLVPIGNNSPRTKIDIATLNCRNLGLAKSSQPQELHEVARLLRFSIKLLRANVGYDSPELLKCRRRPNRFLALAVG